MNKHNLFVGLRVLFVSIIAVLGFILLLLVGRLILPFIIAFFIALIINPLVDFLQRKTKMSRGFSVIAAILLILGVISTAITLLVNEIIQGFAYLSKVVPEHYNKMAMYFEDMYIHKIFPLYNNLLSLFRDLEQNQQSTLLESAQFLGEKLTNGFSSLIQSLGNGLYLVITKIPSIGTILIISLLATFFISKDWHLVIRSMNEKIPEKIHTRINKVHEGLQRALLGFLKAEFKLTFLSAALVLIGLLILRVEHALSIALVIWVVDFLPYIGAILVFLPWIIYSFSTGNVGLGIGLSILYGLVVLQRQFVKPKILSSSIGISPLLTLLTMYVGFKLIGILGIVLGPLIFIFIKILYETGIFKDIWKFVIGKKEDIK